LQATDIVIVIVSVTFYIITLLLSLQYLSTRTTGSESLTRMRSNIW